jgi:hypothetical protein
LIGADGGSALHRCALTSLAQLALSPPFHQVVNAITDDLPQCFGIDVKYAVDKTCCGRSVTSRSCMMLS